MYQITISASSLFEVALAKLLLLVLLAGEVPILPTFFTVYNTVPCFLPAVRALLFRSLQQQPFTARHGDLLGKV
jgi:hypothetical protein